MFLEDNHLRMLRYYRKKTVLNVFVVHYHLMVLLRDGMYFWLIVIV